MSKSTRLSDLQPTGEVNNSTKPLVQDILREIQQEDSAVQQPPQNEMNPSQMESEIPLDEMISQPQEEQIVDNSDPNQYAQQQEQALQYQLDPNVNQPSDNVAHLPEQSMSNNNPMYGQVAPNMLIPENPSMPSGMPSGMPSSMPTMNLQPSDIGSTTITSPKSLSQKILEQSREPLLVMLITILLSIPIVSGYLNLAISKIPGGGNRLPLVPIAIRALLAGLLFFGIRKLF